jgi:nitroreductase
MELYDVLRTTFAAREFTADPLPDETLAKILDQARFAPSGGNRQGWRIIVVRDDGTKRALADLSAFAARRYAAQAQNGENPWNTIDPPRVDAATIAQTTIPPRLTESIATAPVVLVVCLDLKVVASIDQDLDRVGIISGASIYPFVWNVLLASRHEGFGGTITTLATAREADIQTLLGIPSHVAVCALVPLGRPVRRLSKLKRRSVADFTRRERWNGAPFDASAAT